ncbi:MAG: hypothetical protein WAV51_00320 [Microgenomates group bacterium]
MKIKFYLVDVEKKSITSVQDFPAFVDENRKKQVLQNIHDQLRSPEIHVYCFQNGEQVNVVSLVMEVTFEKLMEMRTDALNRVPPVSSVIALLLSHVLQCSQCTDITCSSNPNYKAK